MLLKRPNMIEIWVLFSNAAMHLACMEHHAAWPTLSLLHRASRVVNLLNIKILSICIVTCASRSCASESKPRLRRVGISSVETALQRCCNSANAVCVPWCEHRMYY